MNQPAGGAGPSGVDPRQDKAADPRRMISNTRDRDGIWRSERGFALLIVLWSLALISLLVIQLTLTARGEARLALNLRTAAAAEAAADGAILEATFHLLDASERHWPADGAAHRLQILGAQITVRIDNEAGKIDPNTAQPELLRALLHQVGADTHAAASIAVSIVDWRFPGDQVREGGAKAPQYVAAGRNYGPPGSPFESLDEIDMVLGMTPRLLSRVTPNLTLYHPGEPDPRVAGRTVLEALREAAGALPASSGPIDETTVAITASAIGENNSRFVRRAIIRIGRGGLVDGQLYEVMSWEIPEL